MEARTPEELETLLEDAFVTHHAAALGDLFDEGAVLTVSGSPVVARGRLQIEQEAEAMWARGISI